jgi:hypothetical protein
MAATIDLDILSFSVFKQVVYRPLFKLTSCIDDKRNEEAREGTSVRYISIKTRVSGLTGH